MIGIKEFWVQDLPTLSNYATLDCMDSFCPRIKSNPVEKNCGQHTNLSFKEWLMYLMNKFINCDLFRQKFVKLWFFPSKIIRIVIFFPSKFVNCDFFRIVIFSVRKFTNCYFSSQKFVKIVIFSVKWLMYLTNILFITEIKDKNSSKCEWISFRFFNIFLHFSVLVSHNTTVWCHFWKYKKKSSIWRMQKCQQTFTTFNNFRF